MEPETVDSTNGIDVDPQNPVPFVDPLDEGPNKGRRTLIIVTVAVAAVAITWLYIIFGYKPKLMIDELADPTFPRQAEQVCAAAKDQLAELPFASQARNATERAEWVDQSNRILSGMIDDLEPIVPREPRNVREGVEEWLTDWRTYIADRESYVQRLRKDPRARFLETAKGGPSKGITRAITAFAQVNRMESCSTPADLS